MITHEDHTNALADYLPGGKLFAAKNIKDSNFRQLLRGIAGEMFNAQGYITTLNQEYLPDETNLFLNEWEQALGIPDDCFSGSGTNDERRRDILVKLTALGVQTVADFEQLAVVFGITVTVTPGIDSDYVFANDTDARYSIVIDFTEQVGGSFTYDFPIIFGDTTDFILKCLYQKVDPANCQTIFRSA